MSRQWATGSAPSDAHRSVRRLARPTGLSAGPEERALSPNRNGGRHCCQPPLRRAKDMPVFATLAQGPVFDPGSPAQASLPIVVLPGGRFSTFCGPSWIDPLRVACSRGSRELRREDQLFRRLFRWSDLSRSSPHRHPVEIGPSVTCRTFLPLPAFRGGGNFRPDHNLNLPSFSESGKRKMRVIACG